MITKYKQFINEELKNNNVDSYKKIIDSEMIQNDINKETKNNVEDLETIKKNVENLKKDLTTKKGLIDKFQKEITPDNKESAEKLVSKYTDDVKNLETTIKDFETKLTQVKNPTAK